MPDWWEVGFFGNTTSQVGNGDADNDGLNNLAEYNAGTNPTNVDSDGDGMRDGFERGVGRYQVVLGSFRWDVAQYRALAQGGTLATITSAAEKTAIAAQVTEAEMNELWLGGYKLNGAWNWVTGETWNDAAYNNWMPGEPNTGDQDYLRLKTFAEGWDNWWVTPTMVGMPVTIRGYLLEKTQNTDPAKYNFPFITVASSWQDWKPEPLTVPLPNILSPVSGEEFGRSLTLKFTTPARYLGKFTDGQAFTNNSRVEWGLSGTPGRLVRNGGGDIPLNVTASGVWTLYMNTETLAYSFTRITTNGLTYAQWAAQYGLAAGSGAENADSDYLTNAEEYAANTDPQNGDTDGDGLFDDEEVDAFYTLVTMEDNSTPSVRAPFLNGVVLNPLSADTDGDGLPDKYEVRYGLDPTDNGAKTTYANYTGLTLATTGANPNGPGADPDADNFTNLEELNSNSSPIDATSRPASRVLTFQVDLRQEIAKTNNVFITTNNGVEVRGSFNGWAGGTVLTNSSTNGVYTGAILVKGSSNAPIAYKFYGTLTNGTTPVALEYEPNEDRTYTLKGDLVNETLPLVVFGDNISTRQVTFSVNMSVQQALGRFTPGTDKVYLVGDGVAGNWSPGLEMTQVGASAVYAITQAVTGPVGQTRDYKFRVNNSLGYEIDFDPAVVGDQPRVLTLGTRDVAQTVPEAYFNNVSVVPANRTVTFAVNMNAQTNTNKISFNPAIDKVEVRFFGPDAAYQLTNNGSGIFTGSFPLTGAEGTTNNYKYVAVVGTNTFFERVDVPRTNSVLNRNFVLGPTNTPQTVHNAASPALFSGDDGVGPLITLNGAATINLTVGQTYSELGATATDAVDGSVTATPSGTVNTTAAGTYTVTYNASDAAGNAGIPVTRTVVVAAAGSTFAGWSGGATLNSANVGKYAIGGSSSLTATDGVAPTSTVSGGNLVLTAIVRTDDAKLGVVGEAVTSLDNYATSASITTVNGVDAADQTGVPSGHKRQTFTVAQGVDSRKFLRLKATLAP